MQLLTTVFSVERDDCISGDLIFFSILLVIVVVVVAGLPLLIIRSIR